ncbi:MAG: hypothetical protein HYX27_27375 [Acidobacteria bacterium]|nr:hypothetical protein [Acidobacteriota bacterium]
MILPSAQPSPASIAAPKILSALTQSWAQCPQPLRDSFLNLREVAQITLEQVRAVFPMMHLDYSPEWREQIRQLRNNLNDAQADLQNPEDVLQVITFTNMNSRGERHGSAANLALDLAAISDTRVLIIDGNVSAPAMHTALPCPAGPGLCEATRAERIALPYCFHRIAGTQIYMLTAGGTSVSFDVGDLHALLRSLRTQFDWIIVDGPGFDTPSAALAMAAAADGVIMIIEREHDSFRAVAKALSQVQGRRLLGAVMF